MKDTRYLTFALCKGRLAKQTLELLEELGITCEEMKDKDSRKLIFVNEELKLKFFLSKGPDVPTYVEYGAADIGVVGKDTIIEEGRKVHEVLDLGFGKCRMCVCGPQSAAELLKHQEQIRVATKIQNFIQFPLFFQDGIFAYDTDISCTVFDISRHIRSFCKKETQFQLFIDKDQFSGIFILHLLAGDPNFLKQLQCFLCEPSFSQCKCQISHAFSSCGFTVCTFPSAAK